MTWFTGARDTSDKGWHFDAVSLLAVIGESIIERQKHIIVASSFSVLPRLLPAPQAIMNMGSTTQLPLLENVSVIGIHSRSMYDQLDYVAQRIHQTDKLQPYECRVYEICRSESYETVTNTRDLEKYHQSRIMRIRLKPFCVMNILSLASFFLTVGLAVWSILIHDGIGLLAIITMSISSSLSCLSQRSNPEIVRGRTILDKEPSDIVIHTQNGAFVVVRCSGSIAEELYAKRESYISALEPQSPVFKMLMGTSTILLMVSVLLFSNCGWTMQTAIAVTYILLNLCYWAVPALFDEGSFWDLSAIYKITLLKHTYKKNLTCALWETISTTHQVEWVQRLHIIPDTGAWKAWLEEAKGRLSANLDWNPETARDRLMAQESLPHRDP